MLEARSLHKKYGDFNALSGVSFEMRPGEIFGYLGPNGAGKSTTLKLLTFASAPDSGEILFRGKPVSADAAGYKQSLGYVPEVPFLYDLLTGREFLNFVCDMRGIPLSERGAAARYLDAFDMARDADKLISCYSNGMKKKIAIISAILHGPSVLLLDEPTSAMDAVSVKAFRDIISDLRAAGTAILLTTHVLEIAEKMCQRIAVIGKGRILAEGSLDDIKAAGKRPGRELEEAFLLITSPPGGAGSAAEPDGSAGPK